MPVLAPTRAWCSYRSRRARSWPAVLAGLLVTGLVATTTPAFAEDVSLRDRRSDMWRTEAAGTPEPAPDSTVGDILAATVRHQPSTVVVFLRYVDLRRIGPYTNYTVRLENGAGLLREVTLEAGPGSWKGSVRVFRRDGSRATNCLPDHQIDYDSNTVRLLVPRSCLGDPTFVRANLNSFRADVNSRFFSDNPHDDQPFSRFWTRWLRVAPSTR